MTKTWNIFLLEDDEADIALVKVSLNRSGASINLTIAKSIPEAKTILAVQDTKWDCCLLDRIVPGGNGLSLLSESALQNVPCIMLTGLQDETLAIQALQQGLEDYIVKNQLNPQLLVKSINYAIERNNIKRDLSEAKKKLENLVKMDPLTGVLNRRGLEELLVRLYDRSSFDNNSHGIILLDLDDFKGINDSYGYSVGDAALKFVANKLRLLARPLDPVARVGGDEFIIILPNVTAPQMVYIADRIRLALEESLINIDNIELNITVSIGVALLGEAKTVEDLLKSTQNALRKSKVNGKNTVVLEGQNVLE